MLDYVRLSTRPVMYNERALVIITLLKLLEGCLSSSVAANETYQPDHYERIFIFCLTWSVGGLLDLKDRVGFDEEVCRIGSNLPPKEAEDTIYEFLVDTEGAWVHWRT